MVNLVAPLVLWGLWVNLFFYRMPGPFGIWLFAAGTLAILWVFLGKRDIKPGIWIASAMAILGIELASIANDAIRGLLVLAVLAVSGLSLYTLAARLTFVRSVTELITAPFRVFVGYFISAVMSMGAFSFEPVARMFGGGVGKKMKTVVGGLVIGVPICALLLMLFSQADPIFRSTMAGFWRGWPEIQLSQRVILTIVLVALFSPIVRMRLSVATVGSIGNLARWIGVKEAGISAVLVAIVVGLFLVIQAPYIFARAVVPTELSAYGITTYSEYVRKGFGELLFVAVVLYGSLAVGYMAYQRRTAMANWFLWLQGLLAFELVIFVVSVLRRVWLYQVYHGWSLIRIYGSVFLLWIIGLTVILVWRHVKRSRWIAWEMAFTFGVVALLGVWNTEAWIVQTRPPQVNNRVDYIYLSQLSADGYEGWKQALSWAEQTLDTPYGGTIGAESRRTIAYSAEILRQISGNYDKLIRMYGTPEQQRAYFDRQRVEVLGQKRLLYDYVVSQGENAGVRDTLKKDLDLLQQVRSWSLDEAATQIRIEGYLPKEFDMHYQFYSLYWGRDPRPLVKGAFDRLLVGNGSERQVFSLMYAGREIETVWRLQQRFVQLQVKVLAQPESERSVNWDVSRDAPFVGD